MMQAYVMDAFSGEIFGGNQAGVVLPDRPLQDDLMQKIAAEFKHSETAFVEPLPDGSVKIRYFTPAGEVELCGHATIASFALLRALGRIGDGTHVARTLSGELRIDVEGDTVWMDMAPPRLLHVIGEETWSELYGAYALTPDVRPEGYAPEIISTGLADIMLPGRDHETLMAAVQNEEAVTELSRRYECVGVHMFCPGDESCSAYCSNFAPLYDIPEECATGTSNGALTWYLFTHDRVVPGAENLFSQGESMGKPSLIHTRLLEDGGQFLVQVGGEVCPVRELEL